MQAYLSNVIVYVTAICVVGIAVALLLRRARAAWREVVLWSTLALVFFAPLAIACFGPSPEQREQPVTAQALFTRSAARMDPAPEARVPAEQVATPTAIGSVPPRLAAPAASSATVIDAALGVWAIGTFVALIAMLRAAFRLRRLRATLEPLADPAMRRAFHRAVAKLRLPDRVEARASTDAVVPFSLGGRRPLVVLPKCLEGALSQDALDAVCLHEGAHIQRRDHGRAWFVRLVVAMWWWHPLVHLTRRAYDAAKEDCCDDEAIRAQASGAPLAAALVDIAARALDPAPATAAGILPIAFRFERRVRDILRERRGTKPLAMVAQSAVDIPFFLCWLIVPGFLPFHDVESIPQDKQQKQAAATRPLPTCSDYFPFAPGASWHYQHTYSNGNAPVPFKQRVLGQVSVDKQHQAWELKTETGKERWGESWAYYGARSDGWYRYRNQYLGGMRGVNAREPELIVFCPLGVSLGWEWDEQLSVQTEAGLGGAGGPARRPSDDDLKTHHKVTIEALDEAVTVPAGTFRCLRIQDLVKGKHYGEATHVTWYAPGVGMVRQTQESSSWDTKMTTELLAYTPGGAAPVVDHEGILRAELARRPQQTIGDAPREIHWVEHKSIATWLKARFARVSGFDSLWRVDARGAVSFDPKSIEDWTKLMRAEGISFKDDMHDSQQAQEIARACAVLLAAARGIDVPKPAKLDDGSVSRVTAGKGEVDAELKATGTTADGKPWFAVVGMTFKGDEVVGVRVSQPQK